MFIVLVAALTSSTNTIENMIADRAVEQCRKMERWDCLMFIRHLGDTGNVRILRRLCLEQDEFGDYAVFVLAQKTPDDEIVSFCKRFEIGSLKWRAAFYRLPDRPKKVGLPYITSICAAGSEAYIRCHCYKLCSSAGWDELLPQARADLKDNTVVTYDPFHNELTLGTVAKSYMERFDKK
jgi:hypothetical protein